MPLFSKGCLRHERDQLIQKLIERTKHTGFSCRLIFDAHHTPDELSFLRQTPLDIVYTPKGMTADEYILECLWTPTAKKSMCVVTHDKGLRRKVVDEGVKVLDFAAFITKVDKKRHEKLKPSTDKTPQSPRWVKQYTEIFEERYNQLDRPCELSSTLSTELNLKFPSKNRSQKE